jgi:hypothetical protein
LCRGERATEEDGRMCTTSIITHLHGGTFSLIYMVEHYHL